MSLIRPPNNVSSWWPNSILNRWMETRAKTLLDQSLTVRTIMELAWEIFTERINELSLFHGNSSNALILNCRHDWQDRLDRTCLVVYVGTLYSCTGKSLGDVMHLRRIPTLTLWKAVLCVYVSWKHEGIPLMVCPLLHLKISNFPSQEWPNTSCPYTAINIQTVKNITWIFWC